MTDTTIAPDAPEDDVTIVIEEGDDQIEASAEGEQPLSTKPADGLAELQAQLSQRDEALAAERIERENDRRAAQEAAREAVRLANENATLHKSGIQSALEAAKGELDGIAAKQADAYDRGEFAQAAKFNADMSRVAAKIDRLEADKDRPSPPPRQEQRQHVDPVEAFASTRTPQSAAWIRANRSFIQSDGMPHPALISADTLAQHRGLQPDTAEYFDFVETQLGVKKAAAALPKPPAARPAPMTAAPVARSAAPSARPQSANEVRLTKGEKELAESMGVSLKDYAKQKLALQRSGELPS